MGLTLLNAKEICDNIDAFGVETLKHYLVHLRYISVTSPLDFDRELACLYIKAFQEELAKRAIHEVLSG